MGWFEVVLGVVCWLLGVVSVRRGIRQNMGYGLWAAAYCVVQYYQGVRLGVVGVLLWWVGCVLLSSSNLL